MDPQLLCEGTHTLASDPNALCIFGCILYLCVYALIHSSVSHYAIDLHWTEALNKNSKWLKEENY